MAELNAKFSIEQKRLRVAFNLEQTTIPAIFKINASGTTWGSISGNIQNQTDLINALNGKQDVLTAGENVRIEDNVISATDTTYTAGQGIDITNGVISNTQTSAEWGNIQGDISDQTDLVNALNEKQDTISDLDTIRENASEGASAYGTIQTYGDIVTHDAADFATATQGSLADTALQPGDDISELNNDVGYITSASLPTVNDGSLTIQRNGSQVAVFTANDAQNITANITVPTQASDIGALPDSTTIEDLTTQAQLDAINSGATATNIGQITTNENDIADIRDLIPTQATSSNQLADKDFVNSSIATNTANFIGTFNSVAELEAYSGPLTNNDYAFVATTDSAGNTLYDRYKYNADTQEWLFEYELNNSSFTAAQWASINSGITSGDVSLIQSALQPNDNVSELVNDAGYITSASLPTVNDGTLTINVNGTVTTFSANQSTDSSATINIPTDTSDLTNGAGYITGITSSDVTTALGYTPYNATNPNNYITASALTPYVLSADLQTALDTKVSKSGDTMTGQLRINRQSGSNFVEMRSGMVQRGTNPTSLVTLGFMQIGDKNGQWLGKNQFQYTTTGEAKMELSARSVTNESIAKLSVGFDSSNNAFATAPATSTTRTNATDIITRGFLNNQGYLTSANIDNITINKNASNKLQTVGVIDQNNTSNTIKTWTGTKAQYDAIVTKDANTLYNITDDTDVTLTLLEALYPVGSIYIGTMATCPLATLGVGTWQLKTSRFLVDKYSNGSDWWELYSDGWCVQGGQIVVNTGASTQLVTFIKPFTDTNYALVFGTFGAGYGSAEANFRCTSYTATDCTFYNNSGTQTTYKWLACGYTSTTTQFNQWERIA